MTTKANDDAPKGAAKTDSRARNSIVFGIATGVTVAITFYFVRFLQRYTDSVGITVLIVSLIVCVVAVLYFLSRWYLSQILAEPMRQQAAELGAALDGIASGEGNLKDVEVRGLIVQTYKTARELGPTLWFVVLAGSLMGAVVVVVGLVNAAVIYQQTEVLERQTTRIDEQTKVMAVEFMNQSAIGIANIDQRLADLRRAERNFGWATIEDSDIMEIASYLPNVSVSDDGEIDFCADGATGCESTFLEAERSLKELGVAAPEFRALARIGGFIVELASTSDLRMPYRLEPENQETLQQMEITVQGSFPVFVLDQSTKVLETAVFTCTGTTQSAYLTLRETMTNLLTTFERGAPSLIDDSTFDLFEGRVKAVIWTEHGQRPIFIDDFFFPALHEVLVDGGLAPDTKVEDVKLSQIGDFIASYGPKSKEYSAEVLAGCAAEMSVTARTKDFILAERERLLSPVSE